MKNHFAFPSRRVWPYILLAFALLANVHRACAWDANAPASLMTFTEADKVAQRQAGMASLKAMYTALDAGLSSYSFKPGIYRFTSYRPFNFTKKSNFAIHAAGCTFIMENLTGELFLIDDCSNMAIIGPLTLDADPLGFSQAKIVSADDKANTVDIEIMPGYPAPPPKSRLMIFAPDGTWQSPSPNKEWPFLNYSNFQWLDQAQQTGRIAVDQHILSLLKPGHYLTLGQGSGIGTLHDVDGMTVQDVTVYTGCTAKVSWGGGSGQWNYVRVKAIPAPGTSRLIGGSGPQYSFGAASQVVFESCEFNGSTDDDLNVGAGSYGMLYKQEAPRSILVMNGAFQKGDEVRLFEKSTYREKTRATVQSVEPLQDAALVEDAKAVQKALLHHRERPHPNLYRITLDRDAVAEPADFLENVSARGASFVMRNCKWTNSTVRVMVQGFKKGVFEGNIFTHVGQGLAVTMDSWWWEGGTWDECIVRDNVFTQTPYVTYWNSAAIHYGPSGVPDTAQELFGPVSIVGNTISKGQGTGISVNATSHYSLKDNAVSEMTVTALTVNSAAEPLRDMSGPTPVIAR